MIQRDVFTSGRYIEQFKPDAPDNPFQGIYDAKRQDLLRSVGSALAPDDRILDLGGGMGRMAVPLARRNSVVLCDLSPDMLTLAERAAAEAQVPSNNLSTRCVNAADRLPFHDRHFDHVLAIDLLVHLPDPTAALREMARVLKPNGELWVDMTNSTPFWTLRYPRYVGRRPGRWLRTWRGGGVLPQWQSIVHHHSHREFMAMLARAGFTVVDEYAYGPGWCPKWFLARCRHQSSRAW